MRKIKYRYIERFAKDRREEEEKKKVSKCPHFFKTAHIDLCLISHSHIFHSIKIKSYKVAHNLFA